MPPAKTCGNCEFFTQIPGQQTGLCFCNPPVPLCRCVFGPTDLGQPDPKHMRYGSVSYALVNIGKSACRFHKRK